MKGNHAIGLLAGLLLCCVTICHSQGVCVDDTFARTFTEPLNTNLTIDAGPLSGRLSFVEKPGLTSIVVEIIGYGFAVSREIAAGTTTLDISEMIPTGTSSNIPTTATSSSPSGTSPSNGEESGASVSRLSGALGAALMLIILPLAIPLRMRTLTAILVASLAVSMSLYTASSQNAPCYEPTLIITIFTPPEYDVLQFELIGDLVVVPYDPAIQVTSPGEYGCDGCPTSDFNMTYSMVIPATSTIMSGTMTGAIGNGQWYLELPQSTGRRQTVSEGSLGGVIPTDEVDGSYVFTIPLFCGTQLLKCVWSNAEGSYVLAVEVISTNCVESDMRVTLTWEIVDNDWDLHLIKADSCYTQDGDCYYSNTNPDWGVLGDPTDDPQLDVDCITGCTVENIFLSPGPQGNMTYYAYVHHYSGRNDFRGAVTFNVGGQTKSSTITSLPLNGLLYVGRIEWPSGTITTTNFDATAYECPATLP